MIYNLFLDDIRTPDMCLVESYMLYLKERDINPLIYNNEWLIVRNYEQFTAFISENGLPELISFDHDLGAEKEHELSLTKEGEKNGYDCAKWLIDYCIDNKLELPQYIIHSYNPVGAENIKNLLENYAKQNRI